MRHRAACVFERDLKGVQEFCAWKKDTETDIENIN